MAQSLEAKIVVLGSQGVGKTSLVHRYVKNQFSPASTTSTVGASFLTKRVVDEDSDTVVRLQIWDTAGQERFRCVLDFLVVITCIWQTLFLEPQTQLFSKNFVRS